MSSLDRIISGLRPTTSSFSASSIADSFSQEIADRSRNVSVEGLAELHENCEILRSTMLHVSGGIAREGARLVKGWSQNFVPYLSGELYMSCSARPETVADLPEGSEIEADRENDLVWFSQARKGQLRGRTVTSRHLVISWMVGYSAPHAWRLHENPESYTIVAYPPQAPPGGPRQEKFLETAYEIVRRLYPDMAKKDLDEASRTAPYIVTRHSAAGTPVPRALGTIAGPRLRKG